MLSLLGLLSIMLVGIIIRIFLDIDALTSCRLVAAVLLVF